MHVAVSLPSGATYSTSSGTAHAPSGRQVCDAHSASAVHDTHIERCISHTGVVYVHCSLSSHMPASIAVRGAQSTSSGWLAQNAGSSCRQPRSNVRIARFDLTIDMVSPVQTRGQNAVVHATTSAAVPARP